MPSPSHPSIIEIRLGDKIRISMDKINRRTSRVNRLMF